MASLTRREFMRSATLTTTGMMAMGMTACSSDDSSNTGADSTQKKKILRFGQQNAKMGLDMQRSTSSGSASIADSIFEAPLRWTEDNELVPCLLAEIPSFEDDKLTLPCTLQENVKFHDGSTLTATDVKYTFERMFTPATAAKSTYMYDMIQGAPEMLAGTATELSGITIQDDTHFTITLREPMVSFINNLGISYAHIFPHEACAEAGEQWGQGTNCIGTGKYRMVSNDEATEVVLEKFAEYHGGEPDLDEVHYHYYDDNNTKLLAFVNGDIDWCDLSSELISQYQNNDSIKDQITSYETLGVYFVNLNLKEGMKLEDRRVRQALSLAINRQEIVDTIISGAGTAASGWLAPQTPGYDPSAHLDYDVDRARELLAEAGVSNLSLSCVLRSNSTIERFMTVIQSYWKEIGVDLQIQTEDSGVWASDWADGSLQITAIGWYPLYADGDNHLYTYFYSENAKGKSSFYNSSEFDDLVTRARVSQDPDERKELYTQADNLVTREDFATIPLYWPKGSFVAKPYVKNAKVGNLIYHMFDLDVDTSDASYKG